MKKTLNALIVFMLLFGLLTSQAVARQETRFDSPVRPATQMSEDKISGIYQGVSTAEKFDISPPLSEIPPKEIDPSNIFVDHDPPGPLGPLGPQDIDPLVQDFIGPNLIPAPIVSFDAFDNQLTYTPPDPVGDVGPNHYVAMSNVHFAIFDKSGNLLYGPVPNNTLWSGFGGDCETDNAGDPIVVYDQLADRWMLTQFTASGPEYFNCVALSTSGNPLGTYYRWAISSGTQFPDYPKYGVWPDGYYISTRETNIGAYALNRQQMLSGDPTPQVITFLVPQNYLAGNGLLPADIDGNVLPPPGSPQYYMGTMDDGAPMGAPDDALNLWEFHVDWAVPSNSTFTLEATIPTADFDSMYPCSPGSRDCIPQPDTTEKIDILSYRQRPLWRLAYRNFGTHESLVTNQSVEAAPSMAGIRWYEVRSPDNSPFIYQQGTYAPGISDGIHRWMGSIAMDHVGNMALGYSASAATGTYPSVWYTGRLATDPLGTMPQGEGSFVNGSGSQLSPGSRWGDYTSMNVDPVDDCTFWYINEYYPTTHNHEWYLRVGAFKFPSCDTLSTDLSILKSATPPGVVPPGGALVYTLSVSNNGPADIVPGDEAEATDDLPSGVSVDSISAPGWTCNQIGQQITCSTDTLPVGPASDIVINANAPDTTGYITNTAIITTSLYDYQPSNDTSNVVTLVDTAPVGTDDNYNTDEDVTLVVPAPGVLVNDNDPDGDTLSATLDTPPVNGDVTLDPDGAFTYTPDEDFNGSDQFTYKLSDGYLEDIVTVLVDVAPVNDAPVAVDDNYNTDEDVTLTVPAPGALDNDGDVDGDSLNATLDTTPANGDVSFNADGSFTYTPEDNFYGVDQFTYIVSDSTLSDTATVFIDVLAINDIPVVEAGTDQVAQEGELLSFSGSFVDPDLLARPVADEGILWDFGDGTSASGTLTPTHTYQDNDSYTVTLTVTDTVGGVGFDTLLVTVDNVTPILPGLTDQAVSPGEAVELDVDFTDPGVFDTHSVVIEWAPGVSETILLEAGITTFYASYTYAQPGSFTVTVTVTDKDGGSTSQTFMVNVAGFKLFLPLLVH